MNKKKKKRVNAVPLTHCGIDASGCRPFASGPCRPLDHGAGPDAQIIEAGGTATSAAGKGGRYRLPRRASNRLVSYSRFVSPPGSPATSRARSRRPSTSRSHALLARRRGREGRGLGLARRSAACRGVGWGLARDHRALVRGSGFFFPGA